jgi:hypothetical protein
MTTTLELSARSRSTTDVERPIVPILIQVPALTVSSRRISRPGTRRRRLRKEVRVAGLTMMSMLPLTLLLLTLGGAGPTERPGIVVVNRVPAAPVGAEVIADVVLTFDTERTGPASTAIVPVVFPGYLLPVDGLEEPAHAGH